MFDDIIFVDTNIPLRAAEFPTPTIEKGLTESCRTVLEFIEENKIKGVTDSCVLEEIVFRGWKEKDFDIGLGIFRDFGLVIDDILSVGRDDLRIFERLSLKYGKTTVEPMDYLHAAVMVNHNIKIICSHDADFDKIKEVKRIDPIDLAKQLKKGMKRRK